MRSSPSLQVFFRAGVLGALEDIREERLSAILSLLQAHMRGYLMRRNYSKLQDQRYTRRLGLYESFSRTTQCRDVSLGSMCRNCTKQEMSLLEISGALFR